MTSSQPHDRLHQLVTRIEAQVAMSDGDFCLVDIPFGSTYELFRDGRWMDATGALYEEVSVQDIVDDIGLGEFVTILERWLEDEP